MIRAYLTERDRQIQDYLAGTKPFLSFSLFVKNTVFPVLESMDKKLEIQDAIYNSGNFDVTYFGVDLPVETFSIDDPDLKNRARHISKFFNSTKYSENSYIEYDFRENCYHKRINFKLSITGSKTYQMYIYYSYSDDGKIWHKINHHTSSHNKYHVEDISIPHLISGTGTAFNSKDGYDFDIRL